MKAPALGWQLLATFVLSLAVLAGLIGWLQNVNIITGNGLYKAMQAEPWISDFRHARLDYANYLYFPLYGALAQLLDFAGLERGVPYRQFAYLNAFFASVGCVLVYGFVHRLTGRGAAAILATLFHLGTGFFLLLGVISEDIMPGYVLILASMLLAGLWFDRPSWRQIAIVAVLFTLGWLVEWRLLFPTLPALGLALLLSHGGWKERAFRVVVLLGAILVTAGIVQQIWEGHNGAIGLPDLIWTGKGVATGWAGLSWGKAWMLLSGVGNYFLIVGGFVDPPSAMRSMRPLLVSVAIQFVIFAAAVVLLWPRRADGKLRATAIVFLGTLGAGQVMNVYAQPQDPQMQINVMPWLTVAWALLVATLLAWRARLIWPLAVLSIVPLAWNVHALSHWRGGDAAYLAALAELEQKFPPDRTVFVYWGFEYITIWQYMLWSRTPDWDGMATVERAPARDPKFKWISVDTGAIRHPQWTAEQDAATIKHDIDQALDLGYRVAVSDIWSWDLAELAGQLAGVSAAGRAPALYAALHDNYEATLVLSDPVAGKFYELRRKSPH
jgi:hypothetical protein